MSLERPEERQRKRCRSPEVNITKGSLGKKRSKSFSPTRPVEKELEFDYRMDSKNRLHVNFPRTGRVHVFNRAGKFHSSTIETHANDLFKVVGTDIKAQNKHAVSITCDNGPDWSHKSPLTQLYMGRLWRDLDLDYLVLVSYAPGHSAENMIEHAWAPLGKFLVGVTLPAALPGEDLPPCRQSGLSSDAKEKKEAKVLDNAIDQLNRLWNDRNFHGHKITSTKVPCLEHHSTNQYNDYQTVKGFFNAGIKARAENEDYRLICQEYKFLMQHCKKSTYRLEFVKCKADFCMHCRSHPVRAVSLMALLQKFENKLVSPTRSPTHPGSFATFLEVAFSPLIIKTSDLDEELPSLKSRGLNNRCFEKGCHYIFSSDADAKRHQRLVHGETPSSTRKSGSAGSVGSNAKKQKTVH